MERLVFELGLAATLMAGAALLAHRLRLSVIPFLILIGLAVGPHIPPVGILDLRFIQSGPTIEFLGRIGVLFLLFYLGLEFSLGRMIRAGRSIALAGTIYISINVSVSALFGYFAGLPLQEALVVVGIMTASSSVIVAKIIVDLRRTARPETGVILGLTMLEDLFLAVYLALVSGLVLRGSASPEEMLTSLAVTSGFLLVLFVIGRVFARWLSGLLNVASSEVFLVLVVAILFITAGISQAIGIVEAIGALLIGLVLAETDHQQRIQQLMVPFRDFFGAIFFFSFGLGLDPLALGGAVGMAVAAASITVGANFLSGLIAARVAGMSARAGVNIGLTVISRGEFAIVMASLARTGGLLPILQPFTAVYVLILSILGPLLSRESGLVYSGLSRLTAWTRREGQTEPAPGPHAPEPGHNPGGGHSTHPGQHLSSRSRSAESGVGEDTEVRRR